MPRAFAIRDLSASLVVVVILAAIILAGLGESRRAARLGEDIASLNRYAVATQSYAADNQDLQWGLTWQGGETYLMMQLDGDIVPTQMPDSDTGAAGYQAVHLIRSIGGRIGPNGMPTLNGWMPHVFYSHLPLMDYLGEDLLTRWTTSAADDVKQNWKDDPENKFDEGLWLPLQPSPTPTNIRFPYSSGFELGTAAWDINQSELGNEFSGKRVQQSGWHNGWNVPGDINLGGRPLSDVVFPAGKAQVYDSHQRHFGSKVYFFGANDGVNAEDPAPRIPTLTYDGAAAVRSMADCNPGWRANSPTVPCQTFFYQPSAWEPPTTIDANQHFSKGFLRWTRGGLKGVDFGAMPLDTGQPEPLGDCNL